MQQLKIHLAVLQGNEDLLKVFLQYIQRCCSGSSPETATHLLGPQLTELVNVSTVVRPEVRHGAMSAVYAAMTAAVHCDEVCYTLGCAVLCCAFKLCCAVLCCMYKLSRAVLCVQTELCRAGWTY